jgi:hypothetical protein
MMSRDYVYVHVCCCDRVGQIGESRTLGRGGRGDGRGYSKVLRWQPPPVSIKDRIILAPMASFDLINMLMGCANQLMIEALDDEPLLHDVMGACKDIILQALPCIDNGFIRELLKGRDLLPKGIGLAQRKKLGEKCIGAFLPG